ncbi:hypothetical protein ACI2LF_43745 [Kribbella sp. NPDC020789]
MTPALISLLSLAGVSAGLTWLFAAAIAVLFPVLVFSVIPTIARDRAADRESARTAYDRAATAPFHVKKES